MRRVNRITNDVPPTPKVSKTPKTSKKLANVTLDEDAELMPGPSTEEATEKTPKHSKNGNGGAGKGKKYQNKNQRVVNGKSRKNGNSSLNGSALNDSSNSSWAEMESYVIGTINCQLSIAGMS